MQINSDLTHFIFVHITESLHNTLKLHFDNCFGTTWSAHTSLHVNEVWPQFTPVAGFFANGELGPTEDGLELLGYSTCLGVVGGGIRGEAAAIN